jgi:hypothetical protein
MQNKIIIAVLMSLFWVQAGNIYASPENISLSNIRCRTARGIHAGGYFFKYYNSEFPKADLPVDSFFRISQVDRTVVSIDNSINRQPGRFVEALSQCQSSISYAFAKYSPTQPLKMRTIAANDCNSAYFIFAELKGQDIKNQTKMTPLHGYISILTASDKSKSEEGSESIICCDSSYPVKSQLSTFTCMPNKQDVLKTLDEELSQSAISELMKYQFKNVFENAF